MNTCTRQDSTRKERRREQVAVSIYANIIVFWDVMYESRKLPGTWCHTTDNNDSNIYHCENLKSHSIWCFQRYQSILKLDDSDGKESENN
jgi:hypothetical protein